MAVGYVPGREIREWLLYGDEYGRMKFDNRPILATFVNTIKVFLC